MIHVARYYETTAPIDAPTDIVSRLDPSDYDQYPSSGLQDLFLRTLDGNITKTASAETFGSLQKRLLSLGYVVMPQITLTSADNRIQRAPVSIVNRRDSEGHLSTITTIDLRHIKQLPEILQEVEAVRIVHDAGSIGETSHVGCSSKNDPDHYFYKITSLQLATLANCLSGIAMDAAPTS